MEELAPYTEFRTATLIDWHPTRREMLISTRFGQAPQIHRVTQPGGARTQLTFYADRVQGGRYRPDGGSFLFSKDIGGGEWYQIYSYDTRTGHAALLTDGKSRNMGALWSRDGAHFAYASTRRNGRDMDIYVGVPDHPEEARRVVEADSGGWEPEDFSPDGKSLAVIRAVSAYEAALLLVDTTSDRQTTLTPRQPGVSYRHARFAPDGKTIYLITNQDSDFEQLAAHGRRHAPGDHPAARFEVGRDLVRSRARRPAHRLHRERKRVGHAARDGYRNAQGDVPAEAAIRQHRRCALACQRARPGLHGCLGAHTVGRLLDRHRYGQAGALDIQRNRGPGCVSILGAGADPVEIVRWPDDLGISVPAAQTVRGAAAGDREHTRRAGRAVSAGLSGRHQLPAERIGGGHCLPECARVDRLRKDVPESG